MSKDTEEEYSVYDELEDAYTRISVLGKEVRHLRGALRNLLNRAEVEMADPEDVPQIQAARSALRLSIDRRREAMKDE